ncbi:Protein of unknown function [Alteribacillus persepolensis]|uniref:DUF2953 domain-containing protein n=1 Tax=Alteribacillus persepolensis TaxID=568899 RepID=A0A1G8BHJ7_9BACI|nr:DUF2953 domain-containing protein [Alteribacillus persepolensis]SDH32050.1 Protein of unknown function [Alteribacillus persepolensis]
MILLLLLAVFFLLTLFIAATPVETYIEFVRKDKKQDIRVKITVWYFFYKTFEIPVMSFDEESASIVFKEKSKASVGDAKEKDVKETPQEMKSQLEMLRLWLNHIQGLRPIAASFLKKIKMYEFTWKSEIGTGDAAWTGFLSGMLWSVKGGAQALAFSVFTRKCTPEMSIHANFQQKKLNTTFSCMFFMRLGHAIIAGIRVIKHMNGNVFKLWQQTKAEINSKEAS